MKKIAVLVLAVFTTGLAALSQNTFSINGTVRWGSEAVGGASIQLLPLGKQQMANDNGFFRFFKIEPGTYEISAVAENGKGRSKTETRFLTVASRICTWSLNCSEITSAAVQRIGQTDDYFIRLNIDSEPGHEYRYKWSINNGEVVAGQGTRFVRVRSKGSSSKSAPSAEVEIVPPTDYSFCARKKSILLAPPGK